MLLAALMALSSGVPAQSAQHPTPVAGGNLYLRVVGLRVSEGSVRAALFRSRENYDAKSKPFRVMVVGVESRACQGVFSNLPFGRYCITLYHDENDNDEFDRNLLGAPRESYGFSNNARVRFAPPVFDKVCFDFDHEDMLVQIDVTRPGGLWSVGLGAAAVSRPYVGANDRIIPIPLVNYVGERLTVAGPRFEYELARRDWITVSVLGEYRFAGFRSSDSPRLDGMRDRDDTFELGLAFRHRLFERFTLRAQFTADVLDKHGGLGGDLALTRNFRSGRWSFSPTLGVSLQSSELADYYYGVRPSEARPSRPAYELGTALDPYLGFTATYQAAPSWLVIGGLNLELLDDEISRSPIVNDEVLATVFVGFIYSL
jgi:outer membrane protein